MEKRQFYGWKLSAAGAALLTVTALLLVRWATGFDGLYGQDAYAYLAYASELKDFWAGGDRPGPFFWPEMYPTAGALLSYLTGNLNFALQLVSVLATGATVYFSARTLEHQRPTSIPASWITFLLLGASPFLFRMALTCMSDALATAALAAAIHFAFAYRDRNVVWLLIAATFAASLAIFTRYAALFLVLPLCLHLALLAFRRKEFLTLSALALATLPPALLHFSLAGFSLPGHHFLSDWSLSHWFQAEFEMQDGSFQYAQVNLLAVLRPLYHPGFLGVGAILVLKGLTELPHKIKLWGLPLIGLPLYLLFIAGIPFQNDRFGLLALPWLVLLVSTAKTPSWMSGWVRFQRGFFLLALLLQAVLVQWALAPRIEDNHRDRRMAETLCRKAPTLVYTFAVDGALRNRCPQVAVLNLWERPLTEAAVGELLLFNLPAFAEQWKGKTVMNNWEFLDSNYNLVPIDTFPAGWTLYEIH